MAEAGSGLMGSIKQLLSTLTSIASTRLELLANELQEERLRLTQMLLFASFVLFCFGMCILLLTAFIVVLFWDDHRLAVLGALSVLFFALGTLMAMLLRSKTQAKCRLFSASLAELAKDREQLETSHDHQPDQL
ncbi:MAG: phage holin family protein [Gallionella sp.]|nr:phage holin family protein [Gallionella sp.]